MPRNLNFSELRAELVDCWPLAWEARWHDHNSAVILSASPVLNYMRVTMEVRRQGPITVTVSGNGCVCRHGEAMDLNGAAAIAYREVQELRRLLEAVPAPAAHTTSDM